MSVALLCYTDFGAAEVTMTYWADHAEAEQVLRELTPCGRKCSGIHSVVEYLGAEQFRVTSMEDP